MFEITPPKTIEKKSDGGYDFFHEEFFKLIDKLENQMASLRFFNALYDECLGVINCYGIKVDFLGREIAFSVEDTNLGLGLYLEHQKKFFSREIIIDFSNESDGIERILCMSKIKDNFFSQLRPYGLHFQNARGDILKEHNYDKLFEEDN
ncbi:MAG: hypothetical protein PVJ67_01565 [Candidatus Pacearchaeota archaeon]|jgi:hypothetical protein